MTSLRIALFALLALIQVSVAQEPTLELLPSSILKALNEGVYVSCKANVEDPELVTEMKWTGPNGQEIPNVENTIITMEGIGGPGILDLMIQNLREQDTGVYNCTATYAGNQRLSAGLLVESYMDIDFGDTPTHQTPFIDTEAKIRCTPVAKPAPQVDWLKDLIPLKNDENHIIQQDGVLIKKVSEADEGVYRCRARVPELGSIDFRDIQVEVYIPPKINVVPEDAKGVELDSVTFKCGALGKPAPTYSWVNKDNELLDGKEGYFVDPEKGVLTIMGLKPEHTGNYRCTAENPAGRDFAEAKLLVLTKPKVEQYLNITKAVDEDAEMRCIATGDPLPEIVFQKETNEDPFQNGINYDDRIEVQQTTDDLGRRVGIMKIRGVMRSDDGLYTCTAESEGGVTQVWGHITVEFPPSFENQHISEVWSWEQEPVNLTCLATSIPNATIQWYFRNEEIKVQDPNFEVLELGPLGVLRVKPSQPYYGDYTCQATNKLGNANYDLVLKEAHVPGPVSAVKVEKKTATTITWSIIDPIDNGGLPIQGFIVQWRLRDMSWDTAEKKFWTKGSTYTLDGLTPQETYIFRFGARNEAGLGEWGGEKSEEMPKRAAPEEPLIFNANAPVVEIPYTDQYTLQWQVPLDNGEPIDFFQIMYYQVRNTSGKWDSSGNKITQESKYPGATSYTIEKLRPDAHYKIELRAHNEIGFSTPAEAIIKTAYDPSAKPGTRGPSMTYSSVAPSTSAPAHADIRPEPSTGGVGTGLIVGIVVIIVLIAVVLVDVICYCTKNAGLTAAIVGKRGSKDKDKEAMLEDGKNASDEKHEGNGQMKPTKEDEVKPVPQETDEKVKETTEPTETTPMIQGRYHDTKKSLLNANTENVLLGNIHKQKQINNLQSQSPWNKKGPSSQRSYSESQYADDYRLTPPSVNHGFAGDPNKSCDYNPNDYDANGHPQSIRMALEHPVLISNSFMRNCKSTPALDYDSDSSVDSTYAVPYQDEIPRRYSHMPVQPVPPPRPTKPKPPLPRRNPGTKLTQPRQAHSQENLLAPDTGNRILSSRCNSQDTLLRPSRMYEEVKDPLVGNLKVSDNRSKVKYVISSHEALERLSRDLDNESVKREYPLQSQMLPSRLEQQQQSSLTENKSVPYSPYRAPSQTSCSTFYQPVDAPFYLKKPKVAFGIAAYDDPLTAPPPKIQQSSPLLNKQVEKISKGRPVPPRTMAPQPKKPTVPPPPAPSEFIQPPGSDKKQNTPIKTVTTMYFVERPQRYNWSQSVDHLDDNSNSVPPSEDGSVSFSHPSTISSARSLGSLLCSDSSQRSYNQPTLI